MSAQERDKLFISLSNAPSILMSVVVILGIVAATAGTADAFGVIGTKWPPGPALPSPGAASFSVMPAGLNMTGDVSGHGHSADLGNSTNFNALITLGANQNEVNHVLTAMNTWAAATQLANLGVVADNGALYNAAPADPRVLAGPFGDIRLAGTGITQPSPTRFELAHAHFPPPFFGVSAPGDVHFNNALTWSDDAADSTADADFDFQTVALHGLGHSLGLLHSNAPGAVMNPFYAGGRRALTADDVGGIQAIYGPQGLPPCVPPPSAYAAAQHSYPGFDINNPIHAGFPKCDPLPGSGQSSSHSFASFFEGDVSAEFFGGDPDDFVHVLGFGDTSVNVTNSDRDGDQVFFDTEMVQLDIRGEGSVFAQQNANGVLYEGVLLPPNIVIRLDPDRPTMGQIVFDEGTFQMDSFFDVFTELSTDGGQTFVKSLTSSRMETSYNFFPEPSTLAILAIGTVAISLRGNRGKRRSR